MKEFTCPSTRNEIKEKQTLVRLKSLEIFDGYTYTPCVNLNTYHSEYYNPNRKSNKKKTENMSSLFLRGAFFKPVYLNLNYINIFRERDT